MADMTAAFQAHAVRVGVSVHGTTRAGASARAVEILRREGCRSAAVAATVPERGEFVRALRAAGLSEVPTVTLWPTRPAMARWVVVLSAVLASHRVDTVVAGVAGGGP